MKHRIIKSLIGISFLVFNFTNAICIDSLRYSISMNYYTDLSDTYGGGRLLTGEFAFTKNWYGFSLLFGHFQSQPVFTYVILVEDLNKTIEIQFDEMAIMQIGSISAKLVPIQSKSFSVDILLGPSFAKACNSRFEKVDYNYSIANNRFIYLYKDYKLVRKYHFGVHVGINISYYLSNRIGVQVNTRIQDLNNGGTFFFVGGGLCFRL